MSYTLEIKGLAELRRMFAKSPQVVGKYLEAGVKDAGAVIINTMTREAPQGETKMLHSAHNIAMNYKPIQVTIYPKMEYAKYVEFGTGIFGPKKSMIYPVNAKALAFKINGKWIFTKSSKGQKPNPFVQRTVERSNNSVNLIFDSVMTKIINNI